MGEWSFGSPFGFLSAGVDIHDLIQALDTRTEVINVLGHLPFFLRPYMKYFFLDPFWYKGFRRLSNIGALGSSALKTRIAKAEAGQNSNRKDLMGFLLDAKDPDTGGPLRPQEIVAEAISFIGGGSHTTSMTMAFFMDFVSRDQELQEEMWKELCEAFPGPRDVDWVAPEEDAGRLALLNAVLKEVMRIRPISSTGLERVVPEDGRMVAGVFLPGGSLVSVPIVSIHHNSNVYEVTSLSPTCVWY
jgi:benzoate 4-monooxygenase